MEREYIITIDKMEPNPLHGQFPPAFQVDRDIAVRQLTARITETEFDCIKQALLKVWK